MLETNCKYMSRRNPIILKSESTRNYRELVDLRPPYLLYWEMEEDEEEWQ